jgi:hypothetical protein
LEIQYGVQDDALHEQASEDNRMGLKKSLVTMSISAALMGGAWEFAVAKQADEEDSVYRWGRWAVLAPAAGQEEVIAFNPPVVNDLLRCESENNCPEPIASSEPPVEPPQSQAEPVGYARIDYRESGSSQAFTRYVGAFDMSLDDSDPASVEAGYIVTGPSAPQGETVILDSGLLPVAVTATGFRSTARDRNSFSGRFTYGADNEVAIVEGPWRQIAADGSHAHSGEFVWGMTATTAEINALMDQLDIGLGGDIFARYSGPTATGGKLDLEFNLSRNTWEGNVQGTVLSFDAGGSLADAKFTADQFSNNITSGEMQGALVNAGHNAIGSFAVESTIGQTTLREADVFNAGLTGGTPTVVPTAQ